PDTFAATITPRKKDPSRARSNTCRAHRPPGRRPHARRAERTERRKESAMADEQAADLSQISPEDFAKLIAAATDDQIETTMRQVGIDTVLERIFEGMKERFRPDKAADVNAEVQFVVTDAG